jgi:hypothetical protein
MAMPISAPVESEGSFWEAGVELAEVGAALVEDEEDVRVVLLELLVEDSGRSDDFQASWIMGANRWSWETHALGTVVKPKLLLEPLSQDTVGTVVAVGCTTHVWPLRLSHLKPVGQQPTKVSSASI